MLELTRKPGQRIFLVDYQTMKIRLIVTVRRVHDYGVKLDFSSEDPAMQNFKEIKTKPIVYGEVINDPFGYRFVVQPKNSGSDVQLNCSCGESDILYREELYNLKMETDSDVQSPSKHGDLR